MISNITVQRMESIPLFRLVFRVRAKSVDLEITLRRNSGGEVLPHKGGVAHDAIRNVEPIHLQHIAYAPLRVSTSRGLRVIACERYGFERGTGGSGHGFRVRVRVRVRARLGLEVRMLGSESEVERGGLGVVRACVRGSAGRG